MTNFTRPDITPNLANLMTLTVLALLTLLLDSARDPRPLREPRPKAISSASSPRNPNSGKEVINEKH